MTKKLKLVISAIVVGLGLVIAIMFFLPAFSHSTSNVKVTTMFIAFGGDVRVEAATYRFPGTSGITAIMVLGFFAPLIGGLIFGGTYFINLKNKSQVQLVDIIVAFIVSLFFLSATVFIMNLISKTQALPVNIVPPSYKKMKDLGFQPTAAPVIAFILAILGSIVSVVSLFTVVLSDEEDQGSQ